MKLQTVLIILVLTALITPVIAQSTSNTVDVLTVAFKLDEVSMKIHVAKTQADNLVTYYSAAATKNDALDQENQLLSNKLAAASDGLTVLKTKISAHKNDFVTIKDEVKQDIDNMVNALLNNDTEPPTVVNGSGDSMYFDYSYAPYFENLKINDCRDNVAMSLTDPYKIDYYHASYNDNCRNEKLYTDNPWGLSNTLTFLNTEKGNYCIRLMCKDSSGNTAKFYSDLIFTFGKINIQNTTLPTAYRGVPYGIMEGQRGFWIGTTPYGGTITYISKQIPAGLNIVSGDSYELIGGTLNGIPSRISETGTYKIVLHADATTSYGNFPRNFDEKEFTLNVDVSNQIINDGSGSVHSLPYSFIEDENYNVVNLVPIYFVPKDLQDNIDPHWKEKITATLDRVKEFHEKQFRGQSVIKYSEPKMIISEKTSSELMIPELVIPSDLPSEWLGFVEDNEHAVVFAVGGYKPMGWASFFYPYKNGGISFLVSGVLDKLDLNTENFQDIVVAHEIEHGDGIPDLKDRSLLGSNGAPDLFPLNNGLYINSLDLIDMGVKGLYPLSIYDVSMVDNNNNVIKSGVTALTGGDRIKLDGSGFVDGLIVNLVYRDANDKPQRTELYAKVQDDTQITATIPKGIDTNLAFIEVVLPNDQRHLYNNIVTVKSSGSENTAQSIAPETTFEDKVL